MTGAVGISAIILFRLRIKEAIKKCLESSNFTLENIQLQPSLITQPIYDLDEDAFFLCYSIAVLDFIYKYSSYLKLFSSDFSSHNVLRNPSVGIIKEVVFAKSEEELLVILANRYSMHLMVNWLKKWHSQMLYMSLMRRVFLR